MFVKPVIQIKDLSDRLHFNVTNMRTINVDYRKMIDSMEECKSEIIRQIKTIEENPVSVSLPVSFKMNYDLLVKEGSKKSNILEQLVLQIEGLTSRIGNVSAGGETYRLREQERRVKLRKKSYYIRRINSNSYIKL